MGIISVSEMLNTFEETFEVTEVRTFKHEPFFGLGWRGGASSWYFMVVHCVVFANTVHCYYSVYF